MMPGLSLMIFHEEVTMAINGIIVTNINHATGKYLLQTEEFLNKSKLIKDLNLTAVNNPHVLSYLKTNKVDFCLFWDKDIYLARTIEAMGIKVFNNPEAIYLCDDKALTAYALEKENIRQPRFFVFPLHFYGNIIEHYEEYKENLLSLNFPMVIKERFGSFGEQVYLAKNENELKDIIESHGTKPLMAQEFIGTNRGQDYRINVVGNEVISSVLRTNDHDFRSNINQGGKAEDVSVNDEVKALAIAATKAIKGHFAGVDIMFKGQTPVVLEVNSNMRTVAVNKVSKSDLTLKILEYIINTL